MRNLYLSNAPAPYRMDFYRSLYRKLDCEICFQDVQGGVPDIPVRRWDLRSLPSLVKEFRPSVVITPEFSAATVRAVFLRNKYGCKVVPTVDDSLDMIRGNDFGWKHRLGRLVVPRLVDDLILHSAEVRDWYGARFGKGLVLPIMADERRFRAELSRVLPLSRELRPGPEPVVAFVGRFVGLKNIPTLIQAHRLLKRWTKLVLIGDGPLRNELEAMAPDALFTGMLSGDERLAWYNLIDVLVLPSRQEAYGAVTGEALMAGAKVAVSRKAGSSVLVREGENGSVVDPEDPAALAERIEALLDGIPDGRCPEVRPNLHPFHFEPSFDALLEALK